MYACMHACMHVQDNDMILCDGRCSCAFHERCLDPPINAAELPEDEGWLCPACDCKVGAVWAAAALIGCTDLPRSCWPFPHASTSNGAA